MPDGHSHLRAPLLLKDGLIITLHEATVANLVRYYVGIKTHPERGGVVLRGRELEARKDGYAGWQLLEVDDEDL